MRGEHWPFSHQSEANSGHRLLLVRQGTQLYLKFCFRLIKETVACIGDLPSLLASQNLVDENWLIGQVIFKASPNFFDAFFTIVKNYNIPIEVIWLLDAKLFPWY